MPLTAPVLRVADASVVLDGRRILSRVTLRVEPGEVVALLGGNGSGKSTLVRTILGLVPLTAGSVEIFGTQLSRFHRWERVGFVPQRVTAASGVPATVEEVVTAGRLGRRGLLPRFRKEDRAAVARAIATVGLADRRSEGVSRLSGGQQQRVLIARALAGDPDLLVLDEPTSGVDLASQEAFATTLRELVKRGRTILLVAHELGALESLVDRAVVLRGGRVVHNGAPPPALGYHARADHDHVHPHGDETETRWL